MSMALEHPGYEKLANEVSALFLGPGPPFIFVHDPASVRTTAHVVTSVLASLAPKPTRTDAFSRVSLARLNAVACLSPRVLYDTVLNQLAGWQVTWNDGASVWRGQNDEHRWNENLDGFLHGLQALGGREGIGKEKGKGRDVDITHMAIVIERAERLRDQLPELVVPLTRLAEMARVPLSVIFISEVPWPDLRPPFGASPDPYYVDVSPLSKEDISRRLNALFRTISSSVSKSDLSNPYNPTLQSLYGHFVSVLLDSCTLYVQNPDELQYIAAARWPGFVQPVLDANNRADDIEDADMDTESLTMRPPNEGERMRLIRLFKPTFKTALEKLYPRLDHAANWAQSNAPPHDLLSKPVRETQPFGDGAEPAGDAMDKRILDLARMSKFILIAAYLASTNPPNSDVRMFGRGLDEKKRKRRTVRVTKAGTTKAPQRVLGPNPVPLDRLLAILGIILEENDADNRLDSDEYPIPGEYTDMELARVGTNALILELSSIGLLHRTSAADRLDGPPTFRCGISYATASILAKELDVALDDLLWDPA